MSHLLAFFAFAVSVQQVADDEETRFKALIVQSNECIKREVDSRIPADKISLSDKERSVVRMSAASACDRYNGEIAKFTSAYRSRAKTLAQVTEDMLATSLRIADALAVTRVKSNAESQK